VHSESFIQQYFPAMVAKVGGGSGTLAPSPLASPSTSARPTTADMGDDKEAEKAGSSKPPPSYESTVKQPGY